MNRLTVRLKNVGPLLKTAYSLEFDELRLEASCRLGACRWRLESTDYQLAIRSPTDAEILFDGQKKGEIHRHYDWWHILYNGIPYRGVLKKKTIDVYDGERRIAALTKVTWLKFECVFRRENDVSMILAFILFLYSE